MGKNGPNGTPGRLKRHRSRRIISDSTDEDPGRNTRHGIRGRRIISDTSVEEEPEQPVTESAGQNAGPSTASKTEITNTLSNIAKSLASIPTGEVACGTELVDMPLPSLELITGEVVRFPYDEPQMDLVKDIAKQVRDKRFGIHWDKIKRTPTWVVPGCGVDVQHPEWEKYLDSLARMAGKYLGFGNAKLTTKLQALHLWEEGSIWRDYHNELWDPTRVGNLLIILNKAYKGGEIAIGSGDKEMFFDPAAAMYDQFYIASHNRAKHETLPLTKGHRLGLAYDLRLATNKGKPASVHDLLEALNDAENDLFYNLACWAEELDTGARPHHPLLYVLAGTYGPRDIGVRHMTPEDRAKVLAVQALQREVYGEPARGKYKLEGYLVAVTATATNYGNGDVGRRVKYSIERATTLEGELRNEVKDVIVGERCVLQEGEFESGDAREVYGKTTTTRRTRTCLMLMLERQGE
ncbi:hypothetical protein C8A01DRAFT_17491 [Parachaetomium inaequale]|uniref:Prolyl 4-hydroxylase alpha subunit Fe(2+) 2OG dioxygenase domain-containing protein n=1 Tax=Parachaetomium inaequale TaxID=2588326 RepID=A0AAN6PGA1_9PEZI|nr:hypothetical protein C8A01DRAFT_17491 [Parachaetomium inaequale]